MEEEIGVVSSEVDDEDMIFPCLDVTLKVLLCIVCFATNVLRSTTHSCGQASIVRCRLYARCLRMKPLLRDQHAQHPS